MTTDQQHPNDLLASRTVGGAVQEFLHDAEVPREGRGPLHELWAVALLTEHGLVTLGEAVRACREAGHSDSDIAGVLGISRQAVSQRWVRVGNPHTQRVADQNGSQGTLPI